MAIGYRFSNQELAVMIRMLGMPQFRLLDINANIISEEQEQQYKEDLCRKGVLIRQQEQYLIDTIVELLIEAIACAKSYTIEEKQKAVVVEQMNLLVLLCRDRKTNEIWHVYPYHNYADMVIDEHGRYPDNSKWVYITSDSTEVMTWKQYIERKMQYE